ncbi:D-alanyl-D-alanine carboxypeptidase [Streptomyces sp. NPDC026672]|uniref:D-alanyl-D-alanine carboxypeptidase n=1 Tax=unclassified Streptomyces TaxID=2593676 RepID=UPI0033CEC79E
MEEASVAGESPDRSKQRESSAEPTPGGGAAVPEARESRRGGENGDGGAGGGAGDTRTRVLTSRGPGASASADSAEPGEPGEESRLRAVVAAWVRPGEPGGPGEPGDGDGAAEGTSEGGTGVVAKAEAASGGPGGVGDGAGAAGDEDAGARTGAGASSSGTPGEPEQSTDRPTDSSPKQDTISATDTTPGAAKTDGPETDASTSTDTEASAGSGTKTTSSGEPDTRSEKAGADTGSKGDGAKAGDRPKAADPRLSLGGPRPKRGDSDEAGARGDDDSKRDAAAKDSTGLKGDGASTADATPRSDAPTAPKVDAAAPKDTDGSATEAAARKNTTPKPDGTTDPRGGDAGAKGDADSVEDSAPASGTGPKGGGNSKGGAGSQGDTTSKPGAAPAEDAGLKTGAAPTGDAESKADADAKGSGAASKTGAGSNGNAIPKPGTGSKGGDAGASKAGDGPVDDARAKGDADPAKSSAPASGTEAEGRGNPKSGSRSQGNADTKTGTGPKGDGSSQADTEPKDDATPTPGTATKGGTTPASGSGPKGGASPAPGTDPRDGAASTADARPKGGADAESGTGPKGGATPAPGTSPKGGAGAKGDGGSKRGADSKGGGVDQPTAMLKAPRPVVDQPTTTLKVGGKKPAAPAEESERTSRFVALKPLDDPTRTTQQPLPPKPPLDLLAELTNTPPPPQTPIRTLVRRVKIWTPLVLLLVVVFAVVQSLRPIPKPALDLTAQDTYTFDGAEVDVPWPAQGQAALDVQGVGSFGSSGDQKPVPIASVAKVMTAYVILRDHPLKSGADGPKIKIDQAAQDQSKAGQESTVDVTAGDALTQREALEGILIASANNVARLLARWDAGSEKSFVTKMNATAKSLGMTNTTYTDPSGLTDSTVSTAVDQVKLAKAAMEQPAFREVAAMMSYDDYKGVNHPNWNQLVGHNDVVGIKTGTTTSALGNLVFAAKKDAGGQTHRIVGAVLRQPAGGPENTILSAALSGGDKLIRAAQGALRTATILKKGAVVGYVDDGLGGRTPVVATKDVTAVGWSGLKVKLSFTADDVPHTAKAGTKVGALTVGDGSGGAVQVPVALGQDLAEPGFTDKLTRLG